jgi:thiosulfate/3-mercaptopyruvate sulfurtransferase
MTEYAHPEALAETTWLAAHLHDPNVRVIECDGGPAAYDSGHIESAVFWNPYRDIMGSDLRVIDNPQAAAEMFARSGIGKETIVVLYGPPSPPGFAFWYLKLFGHRDVRLLDGGRKKWIAEGRPLTIEQPSVAPAQYTPGEQDASLRALREQVEAAVGQPDHAIVDTRRPQEYSGEWFSSKPPQGSERAGHIPGATHVHYENTLREDGTFKPVEELRALYGSCGVTPDKETITYCTLGWRAGHSWFVLTYLLGYPQVRNYDGSWNEWGRLPETPIES